MAVLTYLGHIVDTIDHPALMHLILQYLFGKHRSPFPGTDTSRRPTALARRRKSENLLSHSTNVDALPDFYNLADLIMAGLCSESQQTINAALQLVSIMLRKQHCQVIPMFFKLEIAGDIEELRTIDSQRTDVKKLISMAADLVMFQDIHGSYDRYSDDNRSGLQCHSCSVGLLRNVSVLDNIRSLTQDELKMYATEPCFLQSRDPMIKIYMALMLNFFSNDIGTNLSLTQALIDLASCGYTRLEGWLLGNQRNYYSSTYSTTPDFLDHVHKESPVSSGQTFISDQRPQERPVVGTERVAEGAMKDVSPIFAVLDLLRQKVETFRREINGFDALLLECMVITATDNESDDGTAKKTAKLREQILGMEPIPTSSAKASSQMEPLTTRLQSLRNSATASPSVFRTRSPRGRQRDRASAPAPAEKPKDPPSSPSARPSTPGSTASTSLLSFNQETPPSNPLVASPDRYGGHSIPTILECKFQVRKMVEPNNINLLEALGSETSSLKSDAVRSGTPDGEVKEVTLGHLLTNVIILREFLLELASLIEVRSTMFDEVRFV